MLMNKKCVTLLGLSKDLIASARKRFLVFRASDVSGGGCRTIRGVR